MITFRYRMVGTTIYNLEEEAIKKYLLTYHMSYKTNAINVIFFTCAMCH